jgi:hypothetical protein
MRDVALTANDPEPPDGAVVRDSAGKLWSSDWGIYGGPGAANWMMVDHESDPESWIKVAGNYGPVEIVDLPDPPW